MVVHPHPPRASLWSSHEQESARPGDERNRRRGTGASRRAASADLHSFRQVRRQARSARRLASCSLHPPRTFGPAASPTVFDTSSGRLPNPWRLCIQLVPHWGGPDCRCGVVQGVTLWGPHRSTGANVCQIRPRSRQIRHVRFRWLGLQRAVGHPPQPSRVFARAAAAIAELRRPPSEVPKRSHFHRFSSPTSARLRKPLQDNGLRCRRVPQGRRGQRQRAQDARWSFVTVPSAAGSATKCTGAASKKCVRGDSRLMA